MLVRVHHFSILIMPSSWQERERKTPRDAVRLFFRFEELFDNRSDSSDNNELAGDVR